MDLGGVKYIQHWNYVCKDVPETRSHVMVNQLGDNCIVFENFTASVGDLMVAN